MEVKDILKEMVSLGACSSFEEISDWEGICRLFFTPQGREFCRNKDFPAIGTFRSIKKYVAPYGIHVEELVNRENENIALVGDCGAESNLSFNGTKKAYKVILMHGAKACIRVSNYAVVRVENLSGEYKVINDGTGIVL